VSELRTERQRLDDERRAAVDELTTARHTLDEQQQRITDLEKTLLDNISSSQARSFQSYTPFTQSSKRQAKIKQPSSKCIQNSRARRVL